MEVIGKRKIRGSLVFTAIALAAFMGLSASQAMAQEEANTFSQEVPEQTITFATVNPYTQAPGSMTITFSGVFHANRLTEQIGSGISNITGNQKGTFTFVPDDPSQPTINGKFSFSLAGRPQSHTNKINFAFIMDGLAPDGSRVRFLQTERAVVSEASFDISFGSTDREVPANDN